MTFCAHSQFFALVPHFRHLAEKWEKQRITRTRMATGRNGGSTSNNLDGIELFVLLDLLGVENPRVPSYFGATHWAHEHSLTIEQRLWDAKLHGGQVLARRKEGRSEERADEDDDDMDQLETEEPMTAFFTKQASYGGIDDDHRPFMHRGVPIFHVIPTPFPHVWHKLEVKRFVPCFCGRVPLFFFIFIFDPIFSPTKYRSTNARHYRHSILLVH